MQKIIIKKIEKTSTKFVDTFNTLFLINPIGGFYGFN